MKYFIEPLVSINEVEFNSSPKIVEEKLGTAGKIEIDNIMEEVREMRNGAIFTYMDNQLKAVTFSKHVDVFFGEFNIMHDANVIEKLKKIDPNFKEQKDTSYLFENLGLILSGFGKKKIKEGKLIISFSSDMFKLYKYYGNV